MLLLKVPILPGFAYHKCQPGEAGSCKLITGLSFPCSIHGEVLMGKHLSSSPSIQSVNSAPAAAKPASVVPQNLTAGLVLSLTEDF